VGETDTATIVEVADSLSDSVLILMGVVAVVIIIGVEDFRFGLESMASEVDEGAEDGAG
jgi:hypothetical protein